MTWDGRTSPVALDDLSGILNKGAATGVEVTGQKVKLACVSLNRSAWTITAGRGFP